MYLLTTHPAGKGGKMKFRLLLWGLSLVLKWSAKTNTAFKHYIRKGKVRILIKTADGKYARVFIFDSGKVSSFSGQTSDYNVALIWKNATVGFKGMMDKGKDASFNAAAAGNLKIHGMSIYALWFENGTKLIM